jgi:predicted CXXCH cytochrome family protein
MAARSYIGALLLTMGLAACASSSLSSSAAREDTAPKPTVHSNILRADYAGSAACTPCHARVATQWRSSPMHKMTRAIATAAIDAPFAGEVFAFKGDDVVMETHEGRHYMRLRARKDGEHLWWVTKVIGGRVREDFAGVEVGDVDATSATHADLREERVLPASYLKAARRWRYKGYSVMVTERDRIEPGALWRTTCIFCHNETPYLTTVYGGIDAGPHPTYQGSVSSALLPRAKLWSLAVDDEPGLVRAIDAEVARLDERATQPSTTLGHALDRAALTMRNRFGERDLVEVGIGCESCHLGSRAHTHNPALRPADVPTSPLVHVQTEGGTAAATPAQRINHLCARCHTVLFSRYPYTWEGGHRQDKSGSSSINSGEARDLLLGACASQLSCVRCHDPHTQDDKGTLRAMGTVAGNGLCLSCHQRVGDDVTAHTHHNADSAGSACMACHMPQKNAGLDGRLTRNHRIGSPTDIERVQGDRPLECALCHVDSSVDTLVASMETWWGKQYDRAALRTLYGDTTQNAVRATLEKGKPHEQMVAAALLDAQGRVGDVDALLRVLPHRYPIVRPYVRDAIEALTHRTMDLDLDLDAGPLAQQAQAWWSTQEP